jgi:hypothetical protein
MGYVLFRNNSGMMMNANGQPVRFGLFKGSSDLIGIGPEGRFMAFECKHRKWKWTGTQHEREQLAFIVHVFLRGGISGFVRSGAELAALIGNFERRRFPGHEVRLGNEATQ